MYFIEVEIDCIFSIHFTFVRLSTQWHMIEDPFGADKTLHVNVSAGVN